MMKSIHHHCTVAVLILVICGNCVISQKTLAVAAGSDQQKVLSTTANVITAASSSSSSSTTTTTTTVKPLLTSPTASTPTTNATSPTRSVSSKVKNASSENVKTNESSNEEAFESSAEILSDTGDVAPSSISPTTYRPSARPSIGPFSSAQERERKLMNVLAARRTALQRGGYRTRVGTTGRTAIATSNIETTPKTPTDPRSICIRNCTKNFTRRTTASCMRQCANFQRNNANGTMIVVKAGSKTGLGTQSERDTNEILFTDESSHGLFVVAKDQNDTLNHIPETGVKGSVGGNGGSYKFRSRSKTTTANIATVTVATTSIEDDEIAPYLYFGQKLPPIRPAMLAITSVSDDHPKLLEVSVISTTPAASVSTPKTTKLTSTLSPVERSRSRYKYNMRDRGSLPFNRRFTGTLGPRQSFLNAAENLTSEIRPEDVPTKSNATKPTMLGAEEIMLSKPNVDKLQSVVATVSSATPTSTPLIITVLSDEEEITEVPIEVPIKTKPLATASTMQSTEMPTTTKTITTTTQAASSSTTANIIPIISTITTTTAPKSTTTESKPIESSTVKSTTTTALPPNSPTPSSKITPRIKEFTTSQPSTTTTSSTTTTTTQRSTTTTTTSPRTKSIIEEDTERLRALGPSLTQQYNIDDGANLVVFINRSTTIEPPLPSVPFEPSLDPASTILHTSVLTSVRSTVHPRTSTALPPSVDHVVTSRTDLAGTDQHSTAAPTSSIASDISSTIVAEEREVTIEMRRINMATYVLAGIGIFPLIAVIAYIMRNMIIRHNMKTDEVFDVCITDQQPISPVKKLDSKYANDHDDDEVDHHQPHHHHQLNHHVPLHKTHSSPHQQQKQLVQQKSQQQQRDANFNIKSSGGSNMNTNDIMNSGRYDEHCSVTSDQEFDRNNIRLKSLLGEGNFGQVWKAEADDLCGHFGATRIVAVKTVRACSAQVGLKDEANIMRKLGSHQNVVTLLGACVESEPHMLIMEYAMRGRLLSLLRAARNATNILPASVPGGRSLAPLSPRTLAGFALDIACGMEYIAERRIVHRDLAARNVLLDHNGVCKICDFGMSLDLDAEQEQKTLQKLRHKKEIEAKNCANEIMRSNSHKFKFDFGGRFIINHWSNSLGNHSNAQHKDQEKNNEKKSHGHSPDTISRRPALPIRWMAPEALQYHIFTTETDIWAFGIVLWEIATLGSTPYSHLTGREVIRNVPNGLRPDLPKEGRHEFYKLMSRCWHKDPQMRPSFTFCRMEISRSLGKWVEDDSAASDYMDVSGFSEDLEHGMVYFNHRISEFECEI